MKLGEGGEAFFVFETSDEIPESLQTSPVMSPAASPPSLLSNVSSAPSTLQEPEYLDLNTNASRQQRLSATLQTLPMGSGVVRAKSDLGSMAASQELLDAGISLEKQADATSMEADQEGKPTYNGHPISIKRSASEDLFPSSTSDGTAGNAIGNFQMSSTTPALATSVPTERSVSPPPISANEAVNRAKSLSQKLSGSNIPSQVTDSGDLMLDMTGYKSSEEDALRAEVIARKILAEELEGNYDIGALIGADEHGNLWIYSSEEAKEAATRKIGLRGLVPSPVISDAASDPGYHSDEEKHSPSTLPTPKHQRAQSDAAFQHHTSTHAHATEASGSGDPNRNYAKTLRLTSDQLKALQLKPGANSMSFSVNRATCQAYMYYWQFDVPIVISDIDGTITKYGYIKFT